MTLIHSQLSVGQAATAANALIAFVQTSLTMFLVALFIHFMPKSNTALSWSSIARMIHSSSWPTILDTDSNSSVGADAITKALSLLMTVNVILCAITSVILPLGFREGPLTPAKYQQADARYVPDSSAFGVATSPKRDQFSYCRPCGNDTVRTRCPDGRTSIAFSPDIIEIFNSTPHGPFSMQYRRFFNDEETPDCSGGFRSTIQSLITRSDSIFAVEGVVVDMSSGHPGIGFWNQTLPTFVDGGTWSQDMLWLEPVTECVSTNLTISYSAGETFINSGVPNEDFNITDQGGLMDTIQGPSLSGNGGQQTDLALSARMGAISYNLAVMRLFNLTQVPERPGSIFHVTSDLQDLIDDSLHFSLIGSEPTTVQILQIPDLSGVCQKVSPNATVDISNIHTSCGLFLGSPIRSDGGDPHVAEDGSIWTHELHMCASATRAGIQRLTFSTNNTNDLKLVHISRRPIQSALLWAVESASVRTGDTNPMWGRVDESYENSPSLSTIRNSSFYLPAGVASTTILFDPSFPAGQPHAAHSYTWSINYGSAGSLIVDYSGGSDYGMRVRFESLLKNNSTRGQAQIRNLIWTEIMANNLVGTPTNFSLIAAPNMKSLEYDFRYAIPGFILVAIWVPSFFGAIFLLAIQIITFKRMKKVLNHIAIGRAVVGSSALRIKDTNRLTKSDDDNTHHSTPVDLQVDNFELSHSRQNKNAEKAEGSSDTQLVFCLDKTMEGESLLASPE